MAAGAAYCATRRQPAHEPCKAKPLRLPRPVIDALCGAIGEIAQVSVLYPLDTIKVRCQASGSSVRQVLAGLMHQGVTPRLVSQLYAGVVSASLCSVAVGSLYYLSFCAAKRMALASADKQAAAAAAGGSTHAASGSHAADALTAPGFASISATHSHTHSTQHRQQQQQPEPVLATSPATSTTDSSTSTTSSSSTRANIIAACCAALVGAAVEAPLELFKHQTQAGLLQGNMLRHMLGALQASGPAALYTSLVPFCLKSLPFDMGELLTYSQLRDLKDRAAAAPDSSLGRLLARVPDHAADMAIGAAAGGAAVLLSMPSDCIKTVMETSGRTAGGLSPAASLALFAATGKQLAASRGLAGLFVGAAPRLAEKVPSTCLYWLAVEGCRRHLEPYAA